MTLDDSTNLLSTDASLKLEPENLDGHTLEELVGYLDDNERPANLSIDQSPGCQIALDAMKRLHTISQSLLADDIAASPPRDDSWISNILASIGMESRAGRDIPLAQPTPQASFIVTEGALRGVIRAAGDNIGNALIGRVRLVGNVIEPGDPIVVMVDLSVFVGISIPDTVEEVRTAIRQELNSHSELKIASIDITVHDIYENSSHSADHIERP